MSLEKDIEQLNKLSKKIKRLLRTDFKKAYNLGQNEYNELLGELLIKYGKKKLVEAGAKLPTWLD